MWDDIFQKNDSRDVLSWDLTARKLRDTPQQNPGGDPRKSSSWRLPLEIEINSGQFPRWNWDDIFGEINSWEFSNWMTCFWPSLQFQKQKIMYVIFSGCNVVRASSREVRNTGVGVDEWALNQYTRRTLNLERLLQESFTGINASQTTHSSSVVTGNSLDSPEKRECRQNVREMSEKMSENDPRCFKMGAPESAQNNTCGSIQRQHDFPHLLHDFPNLLFLSSRLPDHHWNLFFSSRMQDHLWNDLSDHL